MPRGQWDTNGKALTTASIDGLPESRQTELARLRREFMLSFCRPAEERAQYASLERILEKSAEKRLRVVLVTPPTSPYFYDIYTSEYDDGFQGDIASLLAAYPDAVWLDYTGDPRFNELTLFMDTDHLNVLGSAVFMKAFSDDLQARGIDIRALP